MYNFSDPEVVKEVVPNERLVVDWTGYETATTIEWTFIPHGDSTTFVSMR
jgi:hypothetical protein